MAIKEEGLLLATGVIFDTPANPLRTLLCNGSWSELTSTRGEILSSEIAGNQLRPNMEEQSETFTAGSNSVENVLAVTAPGYNVNFTFTINRIGLLRNGRLLGACTITNIASLTLTLGTTETIDWVATDTVYFSNGTTAVITAVDDVLKTIDVDAVPAGVTTSTTVTDGFGQLIDAKIVPTKTIEANTNNGFTVTTTTTGV